MSKFWIFVLVVYATAALVVLLAAVLCGCSSPATPETPELENGVTSSTQITPFLEVFRNTVEREYSASIERAAKREIPEHYCISSMYSPCFVCATFKTCPPDTSSPTFTLFNPIPFVGQSNRQQE